MRHNKKFNHLGRTASHRSAMLSNMACSLIKHKRITTTVAKAKALKKFVEPLITKSKDDTTNSRRVVFSNLQDKIAVTELFKEISVKYVSSVDRIIKQVIVWVIMLTLSYHHATATTRTSSPAAPAAETKRALKLNNVLKSCGFFILCPDRQ